MTEYIPKESVLACFHDWIDRRGDIHTPDEMPEYRAIEALEPVDAVETEKLKAEIYKLKCKQDSKNQDYYTGYMSALSTLEGILAEIGEE